MLAHKRWACDIHHQLVASPVGSMTGLTTKFGATDLKHALILGRIGAFLMTIMIVNAITAENLNTGSIKLGNATFAVDADTSEEGGRLPLRRAE